MYNRKVISYLMKNRSASENFFYRMLGRRMKSWNLQLERRASLNKGSWTYRVNNYYKNIIINLDMTKDNVTPVGLVAFITSIALCSSIFFVVWSKQFALFLPAFFVIYYFVVILFKFVSILLYEKKESDIMDTEDLIAMDVKGGVYNAIIRYRESFHPTMRPYFEEFIDNVQNKGFGFSQSMLILNDKLGQTFSDFAQKAILYEEKADSTLVDIFSPIIEFNRRKRDLREKNNKKFTDLRRQFLISVCIIGGYGFFSITNDPFISNFFLNTLMGKLLILFDILLITAVLSYLAAVKVKFL